MFRFFKAIGFVICLSVILFFAKRFAATTAYFVWEKTEIKVPYGATLNDYTDDYIVRLYVDGVESFDFIVEKETNCSTFSTVLTNHIGKYRVYYQAYSNSYNLRSTAEIIFDVYDANAPQIIGNSDIYLEIGETLSLTNHLQFIDDVDEAIDLQITLNDKAVCYQYLGDYPIYVEAIDNYGNLCSREFTLHLKDETPPIIKPKKPLVFSLNANDVTNFFEVIDNYEYGQTHLEILTFMNSSVGDSIITLKAVDFSGNVTIQTFKCLIIDDIAPIAELWNQNVSLDIATISIIDDDFFMQFVKSYDDNYCQKEDISVSIVTDCVLEVGDYEVLYSFTDLFANSTSVKLILKLRETVGPLLSGFDILYLSVGEEVDLKSLVTVFDPFDGEAVKRLEIIASNLNIEEELEFSNDRQEMLTANPKSPFSSLITENIIIIAINITFLILAFFLFYLLFKRKKTRD